jgi:FkbM family methyltransferase
MWSTLTLSAARILGHGVDFKGRERIIRILASPDRMSSKPFEIDFFGLRYSGDLSSYIDWRVYVFGAYEPSGLRFLERAAKARRRAGSGPAVYWDVGANCGQHVLFMSRHVDRICAFEPNPAVRRQLERNLAINRLNTVTVLGCALGESQSTGRLYVPTGANRGSGSFSYTDGGRIPIDVEVVSGDLMVANGAPIPHIVKIDVEGFEPKVLAGMRDVLRAHRPIMLLELADSTRREFGGIDGLRDALYPDAVIRGVGARGLCDFDFASTTDVAIIPREMANGI